LKRRTFARPRLESGAEAVRGQTAAAHAAISRLPELMTKGQPRAEENEKPRR
jgi:hypothetical protein